MKIRIALAGLLLFAVCAAAEKPQKITFLVSVDNDDASPVRLEGFASSPEPNGHNHGPDIVLRNVSKSRVKAVLLDRTEIASHCGTGKPARTGANFGFQEVSLAPGDTARLHGDLLSPGRVVSLAKRFGSDIVQVKIALRAAIFADGGRYDRPLDRDPLPWAPRPEPCTDGFPEGAAAIRGAKIAEPASSYRMECSVKDDNLAFCSAP